MEYSLHLTQKVVSRSRPYGFVILILENGDLFVGVVHPEHLLFTASQWSANIWIPCAPCQAVIVGQGLERNDVGWDCRVFGGRAESLAEFKVSLQA